MALKISHLPKHIQKQALATKEPSASRIVLRLPVPPSVNALFGTNWSTRRRFASEAYEDWQTAANVALMECLGYRRPAILGEFSAEYRIGRFADRRKRDLANYEKALSDYIVKRGFVEDDSLMQSLSMRWDDAVPSGSVFIILTHQPERKTNV